MNVKNDIIRLYIVIYRRKKRSIRICGKWKIFYRRTLTRQKTGKSNQEKQSVTACYDFSANCRIVLVSGLIFLLSLFFCVYMWKLIIVARFYLTLWNHSWNALCMNCFISSTKACGNQYIYRDSPEYKEK